MTIPSSKILNVSKSIMAIADLKHNSPNTQQSQSVNININPTAPTTATATTTDQKVVYKEEDPKDNPYLMTRDIEAAMNKTNEISENITEKENTIKALSLIIEIIQNNPLIVNKFVIAELDVLAELIRLMTNSDNVEIDTNDIECSCMKKNYRVVKRIYIKKGEDVFGITQCPILLRLFDNYKISLTLVI